LKCTCQLLEHRSTRMPFMSEFHRSLSLVDYIDDDHDDHDALVVDETQSKSVDEHIDDTDPLTSLKYLFNDMATPHEHLIRRLPRRSTNTSSISTDSGYCDIPTASSKLIPVHLISCTLIPVNVTRTRPMDAHFLTCTCPPSKSIYSSHTTDYQRQRQRKASTHSSSSHLNRIGARPPTDIIDQHCSCNHKYYSTMTMCPTLSLSSSMSTDSTVKINDYLRVNQQTKQQQHNSQPSRKRRTHLRRFVDYREQHDPI
jgi:hypothetical protein